MSKFLNISNRSSDFERGKMETLMKGKVDLLTVSSNASSNGRKGDKVLQKFSASHAHPGISSQKHMCMHRQS